MSRVGAPAIFTLQLACRQLNEAFGGFGCFHVGSSIEKRDYNDVDIRLILTDEEFTALFPDAGNVEHCHWELDARWLILTTAISAHLSKLTGLPVDFQFQPQTYANEKHKGTRFAIGVTLPKEATP